MMLSQFLAQVTGSWLSIAGCGTMILILAETLGQAWEAGRVVRNIDKLETAFAHIHRTEEPIQRVAGQLTLVTRSPGSSLQRLQSASARLLSGPVRRSRYAMHKLELVSPSIGLGWTMAAFVAALPGALETLQNDPGALFSQVGMGGGTSVIGVVCFVVALNQRLRLDMAVERLADLVPDRGAGA